MKRFVCLLLALIMVVSILPATALAASERSTSDKAANLLMQFEGFEAKEYTSGGNHYIGYGTKLDPDEYGTYPDGITESKAKEIMKTYLKDVVDVALNSFTATNNLDLTQEQHDALAIFSYSFGTAWLNGNGPLRAAVLQGKTGNEFINALAQSHGGTPDLDSQYFKGMMNRRLAEANLYLNGEYSPNAPSNYTYVIFDMDGDEDVKSTDKVRAYDSSTYPMVTEKPTIPAGKDFLGWYLQEDMIYDWLGVHVGSPITYLSSETAEKVLVARFSNSGQTNPTYYTVNTNTLPYRDVYNGDMFADDNALAQMIESILESMVGELDAPYAEDMLYYQLKMELLSIGKLKAGTDFLVTSEKQVTREVEVDGKMQTIGLKWLYGKGTAENGSEITGWIYYGRQITDSDIDAITPGTAIATATTTAKVDIREGATADSADIGDIAKGVTVKIYEIKEQQTETGNQLWGKVNVNGVVGWINLVHAEIDAIEDGDNQGTVGTTGTIVNTDYVNIRKGAGVNKTQITQLPRGTKVLVLETKTVNGAQWGRVTWEGLIGGYSEGWVYMYYVQLDGALNGSTGSDSNATNEPVLYTGVVTSNINLNVRAKASVYGDKVTSLPNGTKINIYEVTTKDGVKWGRIGEGQWVCLQYVNLTEVPQNNNSGSTVTTTSIQATVTSNTLDVFLNYNSNSEKVGSLKKGDVVTILERNTENTETGSRIWGRISHNGLAGWINLAYVELKTVTSVNGSTGSTTGTTGSTATPTAEGLVYNCTSVNVRKSAGVGSDIVIKLPANTRVTVYEQITFENAPWAHIKWNNGANEGWACMYYITLSSTITGNGTVGSTTGDSNILNGTNSTTISATGTVNSNIDLNVRSGAGLGYAKIGTLKNGTAVSIYEQAAADGMIWGRINYGSTSGWVCMSYIQINSASSTGKGVMGTIARCFSHVNVRSAPGTNNALLTTIPVGTRVEVFEQQMYSNQYWGRVMQGWICMDYVLLDSELPPGTILDATEPTTEATQPSTEGSADVTINTRNEVPYVIKGTTNLELNVRNDADVDSMKVGTIKAGQNVTILAVKNNNSELWGRIDEYATAGWINLANASNTQNVSYIVKGYVNTDEQAVYVNADTDSMVKGTLNVNTYLEITKLNTDNDIVYGWVESGINGWIPMSRISDKEVDVIPVYKSSTDSFGSDRTSGTTTMAISAYKAVNNSEVVFKLKQGVKVYVGDLKIENGIVWGKLTANGTIGWIDMSAVNYVVNNGAVATELNVRTAKNTTDPENILGTLAAGADVSVCEIGFDSYGNLWGKVYNCNSNTDLNGGYVMICKWDNLYNGNYNINNIFN